MTDKSTDFFKVLVNQLAEDDRLVEKLMPKLLERLEPALSKKPDRWLNVNEAAEYMKCSPDLIYIMVREGTLRATRLGQLRSRKPTLRFKQSDLDTWMEAGGVRELVKA